MTNKGLGTGVIRFVPVANVFPSVIQVIACIAELFTRRLWVMTELNESLKDLDATIASFLISIKQTLSNLVDFSLERCFCRGARCATLKVKYKFSTKNFNLEMNLSQYKPFCVCWSE